MPDLLDVAELIGQRAALWPHAEPERTLPGEVERWLVEALQRLEADPPAAVAAAESAVGFARASRDEGVLARTLLAAAGILTRARRPDRAYLLCIEAEQRFERRDDRWRSSRILLLRAQCWLDVREYERAATQAAQAAERFRRMADSAELARSLSTLALAQRWGGADVDGALASADLAVAVLDEPGTPRRPQLEAGVRAVAARLRIERAQRLARQGDDGGAHAEFAAAEALLAPVATRAGTDAALAEVLAELALARGGPAASARALRALARHARGAAWLQLALVQCERDNRGAAVAAARAAVRHLAARPGDARLVDAGFLLAELLEARADLRGAYEARAEAMRLEAEQQRDAIALRAELIALECDAVQGGAGTEQTLAYAQRLSNVGHLVASVNHELNQPMASISMLAGTALELIELGEHEEVQASLRSMLRLSTRLQGITAQLAAFPARTPARLERIDLRQAVEEALAVLRSRLVRTPCEIAIGFDEASALGVEAQLVRVIANLVHNALDVLEPLATRRIRFACARTADGLVLTIADNGPGLSPAARHRLFQPFFSTKAAGRGLGLGLALSRDVMREMGGDLLAREAPEGGAAFELRLQPA